MRQPTGRYKEGDQQQAPLPTAEAKDQRANQYRANHAAAAQRLPPVANGSHPRGKGQAQKKPEQAHGMMLTAASQKSACTAADAPHSR